MKSDPDYLARLQYQWPFILEDEAQDSSELQEQILHTLAGPKGNWVRVGDPNQAIYETFTTASPQFLRDFMRQKNVQPRDLPESGRSTASIIWLANALVDWTMREHPMLKRARMRWKNLPKYSRLDRAIHSPIRWTTRLAFTWWRSAIPPSRRFRQ